jgi:hypothetical protein
LTPTAESSWTDGEGEGPNGLLAEFRDFVSDRLGEDDDGVEVRLTRRRAIKTSFHQEVDGADPSVDLVMGLERKSAPGLWIPNRPEDSWDPAHPAKHTDLFTSGAPDLVTARARAVRLMKGWNAQYANPGLSSFNIEALAWECIEEAIGEAEVLAELFTYAAKGLAGGETDDPAGVSGPIRLLLDQDEVVARIEKAAELLRQAIDQDEDEEAVREALAEVFWDYVTPAEGSTSKASYADALRRGKTLSVGQSGLSVGAAAGTKPLKRTRSYGDGPGR